MLTIDTIMSPMTLEKLAVIIAQEFENVRKEMRAEIGSLREDLKSVHQEIANLRCEMESGFTRVWEEFALIHEEISGIHHTIDGLNRRLMIVEDRTNLTS